jgi:hypothetical protein
MHRADIDRVYRRAAAARIGKIGDFMSGILDTSHLIVGTRCNASPPSSPSIFSILSLIRSMAREGDRPLGQTSVQFMIVRQRNSR